MEEGEMEEKEAQRTRQVKQIYGIKNPFGKALRCAAPSYNSEI